MQGVGQKLNAAISLKIIALATCEGC